MSTLPCSLNLPYLIYIFPVSILVYSKRLKSTKALSTWEYKSCYISVKQDNLLALRVSRFPDLFDNLNRSIFARMLIFMMLIFIYICWYLYLADICNQGSNLYFRKKNAKYKLAIKVLVIENSLVKKVTFSLSLKWGLA